MIRSLTTTEAASNYSFVRLTPRYLTNASAAVLSSTNTEKTDALICMRSVPSVSAALQWPFLTSGQSIFFHVSSILFYPKNILALFCHCNTILTNTFSFFCYNVVTSKCRKLGGYPDTCRVEIGRFQSQKQTPRVRRVGRRLNYRAVCFHGDHFHSNDSKTIGKKWKTRGNRLRKRMARQLSLRPQTIFNVQKAKIENCLIVYVESQRLKYLTYFGVQFSCNASTFT